MYDLLDLVRLMELLAKIKAEDQMLWVQRMNAVRETTAEIVNDELRDR